MSSGPQGQQGNFGGDTLLYKYIGTCSSGIIPGTFKSSGYFASANLNNISIGFTGQLCFYWKIINYL